MSRLELATQRVRDALESLETAVAAPACKAETDRIAALEAEREQLLAQVAALEEELAAMSGITEQIEERLDGAIGEIRAVLAR